MEQTTHHAQVRCQQRNISGHDLRFVKEYGTKYHRTGAVFYFLGRRDIPEELRHNQAYRDLEGITLLFSQAEDLITAYRNRKACRKIRKKDKRSWPPTTMYN
jgi:hypothetical protein